MRPTTTYIAILGTVIARLRRMAGLQQFELGLLVGINQSSWSKIERGATAISVEYLPILAPTLRAEPNEILAMVDRTVRYAEAQGVQVFKQRLDVPEAAMQSQLSGRAVVALVEAALEESAKPDADGLR